MKRKIILTVFLTILPIVMLITILIFSGCSYNKSILDLDYGFSYAKVCEDGEWNTYEIKKWDDYENDMICIWTKDGKIIYTSSVNIILYGKS